MKKILSTVAALTIAAGVTAQAQTNVASQNAVGYIKHDIAGGDLAMLTVPFFEVDGSDITVDKFLGDQVPNGSAIFKWDSGEQEYVFESKSFLGWNPGTNVFNPGDAFFVKMGGSATQNIFYIMGEVPDSSTLPTGTISVVDGLTMISNPYPVDMFVTNTAVAKAAPNGSAIFFWSEDDQEYKFESKSFLGWSPGTNVLKAGQGMFYKSPTSYTVDEPKPYAYP